MHYDLAILGAGAAGLMAAATAGELSCDPSTGRSNLRIALFEKNAKPGLKVLVCGGGRCNFTNAGSVDFLIEQFGKNGRFLTPALKHLDNQALRDFFAARDVPSHEEPGGKIYPDSNQAQSVVNALLNSIHQLGITIYTGPAGTITSIAQEKNDLTTEDTENTEPPKNVVFVPSVSSVVGFRLTTANGVTHTTAALILAVGGMSYQRMGTTGDGYTFAQSLGHSITTPRPAIVGLLTLEDWPKSLPGLAIPNVQVTIEPPARQKSKFKNLKSHGDMLLTHFGLSGPAILNPSEIIAELLESSPTIQIKIDFAPVHSHEALHALFRNWQQHQGRTQLKKRLSHLAPEITISSTSPDQTAAEAGPAASDQEFRIPRRLAEKFLELEQIPAEQACSSLTASQIHRLIERIKNCRFTVTGTRGFKEAMVTAGGIALGEVNPRTLESKLVPNLFLTGEVLDLTGPSGGYNLQLAFSTGSLAADTVAPRLMETT